MLNAQVRSAAVIGTGMMGPGIALTLALGGVRITILSRTADGRGAWAWRRPVNWRSCLAASRPERPHMRRSARQDLVDGSDAFDETIAACRPGGGVRTGEHGVEAGAVCTHGRAGAARGGAGVQHIGPEHHGDCVAVRTSRASADDAFLESAAPDAAGGNREGRKDVGRSSEGVRRLLAVCGKTPVVVKKDRPGQLGNRLQMALVREAANIVAEGIADAEDVDTVVKNGFGLRMPAYGLLEHMDVAGTGPGTLRCWSMWRRDLYNEPRAPEYLRTMVRDGKLGARTGQGFYDWSAKSVEEVRAARDRFLVEVLRWRKG